MCFVTHGSAVGKSSQEERFLATFFGKNRKKVTFFWSYLKKMSYLYTF